jgi:hypothetical protein
MPTVLPERLERPGGVFPATVAADLALCADLTLAEPAVAVALVTAAYTPDGGAR